MDALLAQYPWMDELLMGFLGLSWKHVVMWVISGLLIYLAVRKGYEPNLLLPIGFGALLANIPASSAVSQVVGEEGFLWTLYKAGIANELFPVLIFIAIVTYVVKPILMYVFVLILIPLLSDQYD